MSDEGILDNVHPVTRVKDELVLNTNTPVIFCDAFDGLKPVTARKRTSQMNPGLDCMTIFENSIIPAYMDTLNSWFAVV